MLKTFDASSQQRIDRYVGLPVDEIVLRVLQECFADVRLLIEQRGEQ
jgi:hypothetical protein